MIQSTFEKAKAQVGEIIDAALKVLYPGAEESFPDYIIEVPADRKNGDFSSNIAMAGAKAFKSAPRAIAEKLIAGMRFEGTLVARAETAGPGFLNFYLAPDFYGEAINEIIEKDTEYGKSDAGGGENILIEFVSANPTGPAHMGNARGGALGDCLASAMEAAGYKVSREFYVNDGGNQIDTFGRSLEIRYLQHFLGDDGPAMTDDAYHGDDITEHAKNYAAEQGDSLVNADPMTRRSALVDYALPKNIAALRENMAKYRISYDRWFFESELYSDGSVDKVIELFKNSDSTYEKDGALWFKSSEEVGEYIGKDGELHDSGDFVLIRSNGFPTYIVPDIAYHYNKLVTRGFDKAINILGADHHGYTKRLSEVLGALGLAEKLDIVLMQFVNLVQDGKVVRMSKRTGKAITLADLLNEIPIDAVRFLFNMRAPSTAMDLDLDVALKQDSQNPVYYTQYAHARICSVIKNCAAEGIKERPVTQSELALLDTPEEQALISLISTLPTVVADSAREYDPSKITRYAMSVASFFHKFYTERRVNSGSEPLTQARLALCRAVKITLCNILAMLKITAPESM